MRKALLMLLATLLFAALPMFAQHSGGGHSGGGGGHAAPGGGHAAHGGYAEHHGKNGKDVSKGKHSPYRYAAGGPAHNYYHGGRYDQEYFGAHWGANNRFYLAHCNWYGGDPFYGGNPFFVGSWFWFGGGYWTIIDPIPEDWYDDEVYVDYVDDYGYALLNPNYPDVRFHVGVRF